MGGCPSFSLIRTYPEVTEVEGSYRDEEKEQYVVFLHGYSVTEASARYWNNEIFKRLFWLGYRENYVGITWQGDAVEDHPTLSLFQFSESVNIALHTSPSVYKFIRNKMMGEWHVPSDQINLTAHSLGNLVMWDALRLSQHFPGGKIANNILSMEAALWQDAFLPYAERSFTPAAKTYQPSELMQHSWAFWFRQPSGEALHGANQLFHSYLDDDYALDWMRWGDWQLNGQLPPPPFTPRNFHYFRENVAVPAGRTLESLISLPALMNQNQRTLVPGIFFDSYPATALDLPMGTTENLLATRNTNARDSDWRTEMHSDQKDLPLYWIYPWYRETFKRVLDIPGQ